MNYNLNIHHRKSIRLKGYDYAQAGLYFITICCQNRANLFGHIENGKMILNDAGIMVENEWLKLPERYKNIQLHEYVVMPNHFHAILEINTQNENITVGATKNKTVGDMVGAFQSIVTVKYIHGVKQNNWERFDGKLWQRNYFEHIIRNDKAYQQISEYIINNPQNWDNDNLK
ncbi:MAG TPA: transposase [Candidatus Kapabacteria bacterium]|nr:transposase [Candidatus Kapabacteria bacterium]